MTSQATVSMSWVQTVLAQAQQQGVPASALLSQAGIDAGELTSARWPVDHITRLWRAAAALTQDPGFGLKTGARVGPASFNVVSFILQSAATLREAFGIVQKYQRLISDAGRFQLLSGPIDSWLIYHPSQGELAFSPHQIEAVLAAVLSFSRWLMPTGLGPRLVCFSHARVGPWSGYRELFACPVTFEQAYSGLLVSNEVLDQALPQAHPQLARIHEQYAAAQLQSLAGERPFEQALQDWLRLHMGPPLPARQAAAAAFGLSERTLARRLQRCGTSYLQLLDAVRRDEALHLVAGTQRDFIDIAHSLGFVELSPFYRAFRRWSGTTPGRWRGG